MHITDDIEYGVSVLIVKHVFVLNGVPVGFIHFILSLGDLVVVIIVGQEVPVEVSIEGAVAERGTVLVALGSVDGPGTTWVKFLICVDDNRLSSWDDLTIVINYFNDFNVLVFALNPVS